MQTRNQLKSGAILSYLNLIVGNVVALVYTPFMLKCLGQADYGTYTTINSIVSYLTIFDLGFSNVIVRYGAQYREEKKYKKEQELYGGFVIIYLFIGLLVLGIGFFLSQNLHVFQGKFKPDELRTAEHLMVLAVLNIAISFPLGVFRAILTVNERYNFLKMVDFFRTILTPICIVLLLLQGYGAVALMVVNVVMNIVAMMLHMYSCYKHIGTKLRFTIFSKTYMAEIFDYSFFVAIGMLVDRIYWSTDQIILAAIEGPKSTAVYSIGVTFPSYFISFSLAISNVLLPRVTMIESSNQNDAEKNIELSKLFLKIGRIQFWVLALVLTGFILWGKEFIVNLWAGEAYEKAYVIALIIMIPSIISLTQNTGISILQAKKKIKFRTYSNILIALINIVISIPLSQRWGGIGAAVGTTLGTICGPIICMNIYYWKKIGINIPYYWKNFFKMSFSLIIPIFCGMGIKKVIEIQSYFSLFVSAILYTAIYILCAYKLGMNAYERDQILKILKKSK